MMIKGFMPPKDLTMMTPDVSEKEEVNGSRFEIFGGADQQDLNCEMEEMI